MKNIYQRAEDYAEKIYRRKLVKRKLTPWERKNLKESRRKSYISIAKTQRAIDIEKAYEVIHNMIVDGFDFNIRDSGYILEIFNNRMNEDEC